MTLFEICAVLITLAAIFNYVNSRYLKMPMTIGLMVMALVLSLVVLAVGLVVPEVRSFATTLLAGIDFNKALMDGMLGLLLFAGALHLIDREAQLLARRVEFRLQLAIRGRLLGPDGRAISGRGKSLDR